MTKIAQMPAEFVFSRVRKEIVLLQPGEAGWIRDIDVLVDSQRRTFLSDHAVCEPESNDWRQTVHVRRDTIGFHITVHPGGIDGTTYPSWEIDTDDLVAMHYLPVASITFDKECPSKDGWGSRR